MTRITGIRIADANAFTLDISCSLDVASTANHVAHISDINSNRRSMYRPRIISMYNKGVANAGMLSMITTHEKSFKCESIQPFPPRALAKPKDISAHNSQFISNWPTIMDGRYSNGEMKVMSSISTISCSKRVYGTDLKNEKRSVDEIITMVLVFPLVTSFTSVSVSRNVFPIWDRS